VIAVIARDRRDRKSKNFLAAKGNSKTKLTTEDAEAAQGKAKLRATPKPF
jgi:hypothetical protein